MCRRRFSKFAAYCSALGVDVDKADEAVAADFDLAFRAAGKTYGQQHIEFDAPLFSPPTGQGSRNRLPAA